MDSFQDEEFLSTVPPPANVNQILSAVDQFLLQHAAHRQRCIAFITVSITMYRLNSF